jgi:hypothetical protein
MPRDTDGGPKLRATARAATPAATRRETVDFTAYLTRHHATRHRELLDFRLYLQQRHPQRPS